MNTSELSSSVTNAIFTFYQVSGLSLVFFNVQRNVSGAICFLINSLVCVIIIFDNDHRGKAYRKYLLSLQISSTFVSLLCNVYAPIVQVNSRVIFSDSWLSQLLDMATFGAIEVCIIGVTANSYFACVYYRRNVVLPRGSRFCFYGWRQLLLYLCLQIYSIILCGFYFVIAKDSIANEENIPFVMKWVTGKSSYFFIFESTLLYVLGTAFFLYYFFTFVVIILMIGQVFVELKIGMHHASTATKRYQKRAVTSLIFQGIAPNLMYMIPVIVELVLYLTTLPMGLERAAMDQQTSATSALVFSLITTHTVAHSLAILACSPTHRQTIQATVMRMIFGSAVTQITPIQSTHSASNK